MQRWGTARNQLFAPTKAFGAANFVAFSRMRAVLAFFVFVCVITVVRHHRRGAELDPLLEAISASRVCYHSQTETCAVELGESATARFDLHEAENPLFGFLYAQLGLSDLDGMREVLGGAHVQLEDGGSAYGFLTQLPGAAKRISSHDSDRAQYGIPEGRIVSTLLVGTLRNHTWFQLEASSWDPWRNPLASLGHVADYLEYKATGMNVGPLGTSRSTEAHPLALGHVGSVQKACPLACSQLLLQQRGSGPSPTRSVGVGGGGALAFAQAVHRATLSADTGTDARQSGRQASMEPGAGGGEGVLVKGPRGRKSRAAFNQQIASSLGSSDA